MTTGVWQPFDADEEEIESLQVLRPGLPPDLRPAVIAWIQARLKLTYQSGPVSPSVVHDLQASLRISFGWKANTRAHQSDVTSALENLGDKYVWRAVDYLLSEQGRVLGDRPSDAALQMQHILDVGSSIYTTTVSEDKRSRLAHRIPNGELMLMQSAIASHDGAGRHLTRAVNAAYQLEPDPSLAATEAIRAFEAAAGSVVLPRDGKPSIYKISKTMKDQSGWTTVLRSNDGFPVQRDVVVGMIDALGQAQADRHAGDPPTVLEARAHTSLAVTLVNWFANGVVIRVEP